MKTMTRVLLLVTSSGQRETNSFKPDNSDKLQRNSLKLP